MSNHFGKIFRATSFGESHGQAMGVVVEGCPAGLGFDLKALQAELDRRRPGASSIQSSRMESDQAKVLSGVFEGKTLGTPIAVIVENNDQKSESYSFNQENQFRRGHADDMWLQKFGHFDWRGGGRASGRETLTRVIVGSIGKMLLNTLYPELSIHVFSAQIAEYSLSVEEIQKASALKNSEIDAYPARFPSLRASELEQLLHEAKLDGKSYGGVAQIIIRGAPQGLGEPVFGKLKALLAQAYMSVGAVSAVEIGDGFNSVSAEGSQFHSKDTSSSVYGGIRGGISTGEDILIRVGFKPTSSVLDVAKKGRHDPCIVPRALPVLEAMTYWVLADLSLQSRLNRL